VCVASFLFNYGIVFPSEYCRTRIYQGGERGIQTELSAFAKRAKQLSATVPVLECEGVDEDGEIFLVAADNALSSSKTCVFLLAPIELARRMRKINKMNQQPAPWGASRRRAKIS